MYQVFIFVLGIFILYNEDFSLTQERFSRYEDVEDSSMTNSRRRYGPSDDRYPWYSLSSWDQNKEYCKYNNSFDNQTTTLREVFSKSSMSYHVHQRSK